jgi:hypothetical protein
MPLTNIDFSKTIMYKICCKNLNIIDIYIGHTTDFKKRKYCHKSDCNNIKKKYHYNLNVYEFIRNNGGWDNWDMIEIEKYNAIDSNDARKRERYWIEELKATLNYYIPSKTQQERQKEEYYKEYKKNYRENNKDFIAEKKKEFYENNKNEINEKCKQYYENNKNEINEKRKEKIICECGCEIRKNDLKRHEKSKKHINNISVKTIFNYSIKNGSVNST